MRLNGIKIGIVGGLILAGFIGGPVNAEYERPPVGKSRSYSADAAFEEAVDLKRFRKGNPDWDTQELVVSGMTALHQEHVQILKELAELKVSVERLEAKK